MAQAQAQGRHSKAGNRKTAAASWRAHATPCVLPDARQPTAHAPATQDLHSCVVWAIEREAATQYWRC